MEIRLSRLSFWSLTKFLTLANLAAWLIVGGTVAAFSFAIASPPSFALESAAQLVASCLVMGAIHTIVLLVGAWLVRSIGRGGPSLLVMADTSPLSSTFE